MGTLALLARFATLARDTGDFTFRSLAEGTHADATARNAVLALALLGFGVKAGLFPLHFWLPPAHAEAPSHVSGLISGVIKIGIYGLLRVVWLVDTLALWWGWTVLAIRRAVGRAGRAVGACAARHQAIARLPSVENIGIILMGLGVGALGAAHGNPVLAALGYGAALLHTVHHALLKSLLFLCAPCTARRERETWSSLVGLLAECR
ncbi:MAG: proton-conducting transporter membrane subunit [Gemmatimonadaceae bacterium]